MRKVVIAWLAALVFLAVLAYALLQLGGAELIQPPWNEAPGSWR